MSKIKDGGLDQYDAESFEQQQFGTDGTERVNMHIIQSSENYMYNCMLTTYAKFKEFDSSSFAI